MAHKYILDTHALVWYLEGNPRLGDQARRIMDDANSLMVLPLIALAEAVLLIERGRIGIPKVSDLLNDILDDNRIEIYPLTWNIFERCLSAEGLKVPELHDRFIVGTGLYLQDLGDTVQIITKDREITHAQVIPIIW